MDEFWNLQDSIARLYHTNTKTTRAIWATYQLSETDITKGARGLGIKPYPHAPRVPLPEEIVDTNLSLIETIQERRSSRNWAENNISLPQLGTLLKYGAGITRVKEINGVKHYYRAAPSGGARYPIEIYPIIFRVDDVKKGIYHYNYLEHSLEILQTSENIESIFSSRTAYPEFIQGSGICFVLTAMFSRTISKYADRGYRYILLEAGHIAQNISLIATSMGLGSFCLAGSIEDEVEEMLWLDGWEESQIYTIVVGQLAEPDHDLLTRKLLK